MDISLIEQLFGPIRQCDFYLATKVLLKYIFDNRSSKEFSYLKTNQEVVIYLIDDVARYRIVHNGDAIKFSKIKSIKPLREMEFYQETRFYVNANRIYNMNTYEDWVTVLEVLEHLHLTNLLYTYVDNFGFIDNSTLIMTKIS